jgi:RNA polymerase sigma-70 factor (ECF subfamily)
MRDMSQDAEPTDSALVGAYRTGDQAAAAELVRRHAASVARYLMGLGAQRGDVEDLVQETFFKAFRALAGWRGDGSFRGWVLRIAANLRKDQFRRERGRLLFSIEDHDVVDAADPEAELGAADLASRLEAGIHRLPRLQREVFLLRAQQGLAYEEISRVLGTTPGAARVHYHHAVKHLKEMTK